MTDLQKAKYQNRINVMTEALRESVDKIIIELTPMDHAERNAVLRELISTRQHWFGTDAVKESFRRHTRK